MLIVGFEMDEIKKMKNQLPSKFEMKDLGATKHILGMRISKDEKMGNLRLS